MSFSHRKKKKKVQHCLFFFFDGTGRVKWERRGAWKQPLAPMIKSNEAESHGRLLEFPQNAKQND